MRFRCERDELHRAVQAVTGVVAAKGVHAIYESCELNAADGRLTIRATDLEIGMRIELGSESALEIERPGTAVVPAHRLASILREMPNGPVTITWDAERRDAVVEAGRARFQLQGQSPEDFPEIPTVESGQAIVLSAGDFRELVRKTGFAAAKERMRFALNGILIVVGAEGLEFVATDGRRLARMTSACENPDGIEFRAIVPTKGLQQLDRAVADDDTPIRIAVGNNHFSGSTDQVTVVSRLVEGTFPPYQDVIPSSCSQSARIDVAQFHAALKRTSLVTTRDAQSVKLSFDAGSVKLSARSAEGSANEELPCEYAGDAIDLGYNPTFLMDVLGLLATDTVVFEWNDATAPACVREGDYTYVVMPLTLE